MGRIWQTFWMVFGIAIIAYMTSSITSVMTVAHIDNSIASLSDLQENPSAFVQAVSLNSF